MEVGVEIAKTTLGCIGLTNDRAPLEKFVVVAGSGVGALQELKVPFHLQVELNGYIQLSLVPIFSIDLGDQRLLRLSDINMITRFESGGKWSYKYFFVPEFFCGYSLLCTFSI